MDIAGSVLGGLGGIGSAIGSAVSAASSNRAYKKIAREQMAFQERMYKNRHTYEVADLRKAGLNPILSATGGSGGSVPGGASAPQVQPDFSGLSETGRSIGSALQRRLEKRRIENENELYKSNIDVNSARAEAERSTVRLNDANARLLDTRSAIESLGIPAAENSARFAQSKAGKVASVLGGYSGIARDIVDAGVSIGAVGSGAKSLWSGAKSLWNRWRHGDVTPVRRSPIRYTPILNRNYSPIRHF